MEKHELIKPRGIFVDNFLKHNKSPTSTESGLSLGSSTVVSSLTVVGVFATASDDDDNFGRLTSIFESVVDAEALFWGDGI